MMAGNEGGSLTQADLRGQGTLRARRIAAGLIVTVLAACAPRVALDADHRVIVDLHCGFNFDRYVAVGDTIHLYAARTDVRSDVLTCLDSLIPGQHWHSSSSNIVAVNGDGLAIALRPGLVVVYTQTKYGPAQGRIVSLPRLAHFGFGGDSVVVRIGADTELTVDPRDSAGNHLYPMVLFGWVGGSEKGIGGLVTGGGPSVSVVPNHAGRAYLIGRLGLHADTILVVARDQ